MNRPLLTAAPAALALCACFSGTGPISYETEQGTRLFGGLRGGAWNLASFDFSTVLPRPAAAPVPATAFVRKGALEVHAMDGRSLTGAELAGATLQGTVTWRANGVTMTAPAQLRIDLAVPHANLYGRVAEDPGCGQEAADELEYGASLSLTSPGAPEQWEPLCSGGQVHSTCPAGGRAARAEASLRALAVPGRWTAGGYDPGAGGVSLACLDGVITKCQDWGYKAYGDGALHQTCARMARADYYSVETAHTIDGTPIEIFDGEGGRAPLSPGYAFEAGWRVAALSKPAAVCLSKRRWGTLPLGGFRPEILPDPRWKPLAAGSRFCPEAPLSAADVQDLKDLGAVIFNNSAFIDAGVFRWVGPDGERDTTTRYVLTSYDPATGATETDPPERGAAGWRPALLDTPADSLPRDRTGFEGGLFRHPVPAPFSLPAGTVPLRRWLSGPAERPGDYLTTTMMDPNDGYPSLRGAPAPQRRYVRPAEPEGYLFAPPAQTPPYPDPPSFRGYRTIPLHTWWDPSSRRHLTTADVAFNHRSCKGTDACQPGDRHGSQDPGDPFVFVRLEGYLLCLGCPLPD